MNADPVLLTGDFNIHVDVIDNREASKFLDILNLQELEQHGSGPTDNGGHTLDLVITERDSKLVSTPMLLTI